MQGIVARYRDGRRVKGHTSNFNPAGPSFMIRTAGPSPEQLTVHVAELKAIFFVRTFEGNPNKEDRHGFAPNQPWQGKHAEVKFFDGEVFLGSVPEYNPTAEGFWIFPADPTSNTIKAFAVARSVVSVRFIDKK